MLYIVLSKYVNCQHGDPLLLYTVITVIEICVMCIRMILMKQKRLWHLVKSPRIGGTEDRGEYCFMVIGVDIVLIRGVGYSDERSDPAEFAPCSCRESCRREVSP